MREDLKSILRPQESIVFVGDIPGSNEGSTPFSVQNAAIIFFSSFFVLAIVGLVVGVFTKGGTLTEIAQRAALCVVPLVLLAMALYVSYQKATRALKLTSIIITTERLFHAPAAEFVKAKGWAGPHKGADLELLDQLSVTKTEFSKKDCLRFIHLTEPLTNGEPTSLSTRIIPVKQILDACEALPNYLKISEMQFVEIEGEAPETLLRRARKFTEERRQALNKPKIHP